LEDRFISVPPSPWCQLANGAQVHVDACFVSAITSVFPATVESSAHQLNPTEAFCADVFSSYVFSGGLIQNIWMLTWINNG
jgi:hypothetical protein